MSRRKKRDRAWRRADFRRLSQAMLDAFRAAKPIVVGHRQAGAWIDHAIELATGPYEIPTAASSLRENYSEPDVWRREYMCDWAPAPDRTVLDVEPASAIVPEKIPTKTDEACTTDPALPLAPGSPSCDSSTPGASS